MRLPAELAEEFGVAHWAYALAPLGARSDEVCELIVTALAAQGLLRNHAPSPGGVPNLFVPTAAEEST